MTRPIFAFAGALLLTSLSNSSAAPSPLQLEYRVERSGVQAALSAAYERLLDQNRSDGLTLTRPYVTSIHFHPEGSWKKRNLDGEFELRTSFVSERPLRLANDDLYRALRRLADQHRIEFSLTANPSMVGAEPSGCGCKGEHEPDTLHLDGTPGGPKGSVTELRQAASMPSMPVLVELVPFQILVQSESALYWASRYEVVWSGRVRYQGSLEQRVELLRGLSGSVRASLNPGPGLDAAMTQLVCASLELLNKKRLRDSLASEDSLANEDSPTRGFTELLGSQEVAREHKTRMALETAEEELGYGDFVSARRRLDRAQAKFSPEVEALEARIAAKELTLQPILATNQRLLQANEPGVACRFIESILFQDSATLRFSSALLLDHARALFALGETERAQRRLETVLRLDPGLESEPDVPGMQAGRRE